LCASQENLTAPGTRGDRLQVSNAKSNAPYRLATIAMAVVTLWYLPSLYRMRGFVGALFFACTETFWLTLTVTTPNRPTPRAHVHTRSIYTRSMHAVASVPNLEQTVRMCAPVPRPRSACRTTQTVSVRAASCPGIAVSCACVQFEDRTTGAFHLNLGKYSRGHSSFAQVGSGHSEPSQSNLAKVM
jgi:hypothetical protein